MDSNCTADSLGQGLAWTFKTQLLLEVLNRSAFEAPFGFGNTVSYPRQGHSTANVILDHTQWEIRHFLNSKFLWQKNIKRYFLLKFDHRFIFKTAFFHNVEGRHQGVETLFLQTYRLLALFQRRLPVHSPAGPCWMKVWEVRTTLCKILILVLVGFSSMYGFVVFIVLRSELRTCQTSPLPLRHSPSSYDSPFEFPSKDFFFFFEKVPVGFHLLRRLAFIIN